MNHGISSQTFTGVLYLDRYRFPVNRIPFNQNNQKKCFVALFFFLFLKYLSRSTLSCVDYRIVLKILGTM